MHQAEQIHKLFGIILHRFVSSFPVIYSTIHLCQCKHMDIYCILWVINQCNFFFLCSSHSSFGHWELSIGSCVPLSYTDNYVLVCFPFEIVFSIFFFLLWGTIRCSVLNLYISCTSPTIGLLSKEPWLSETKIQVLSSLICYSLFSHLSFLKLYLFFVLGL